MNDTNPQSLYPMMQMFNIKEFSVKCVGHKYSTILNVQDKNSFICSLSYSLHLYAQNRSMMCEVNTNYILTFCTVCRKQTIFLLIKLLLGSTSVSGLVTGLFFRFWMTQSLSLLWTPDYKQIREAPKHFTLKLVHIDIFKHFKMLFIILFIL